MIDFILVLFISALMGLGIGGGGLYISYLTLWCGISPAVARGTNLLFFIIVSVASIAVHIKKRRIFPMQLLVLVLFGSLGSFIFANFSNFVDPEFSKKVLGSVLILMGFISIHSVIKYKKK